MDGQVRGTLVDDVSLADDDSLVKQAIGLKSQGSL